MKKLLAFLLCSFIISGNLSVATMAIEEDNAVKVEHILLPKKLAKKTPTTIVNSYETKTEILSYNTLQVAFAESFNSQYAKVGDKVVFILTEPLKTEEGTEVLPVSTKIVAEVTNVESPKSFNRNGKVFMDFKHLMFPDGTQKDIKARLFNNEFLSRGKLSALGKGVGTTIGGMALGTGAGCGIGIAASSVLLGGLGIGLPIGFAGGSTIGLFTPGLYYKAKAGDKLNIQLLDNVVIEK